MDHLSLLATVTPTPSERRGGLRSHRLFTLKQRSSH